MQCPQSVVQHWNQNYIRIYFLKCIISCNEMQPKCSSVIVCDYSFCMYESLIVIISDSVPHESNVSPLIINHSIDYDQCVLFFSHLQWKKNTIDLKRDSTRQSLVLITRASAYTHSYTEIIGNESIGCECWYIVRLFPVFIEIEIMLYRLSVTICCCFSFSSSFFLIIFKAHWLCWAHQIWTTITIT